MCPYNSLSPSPLPISQYVSRGTIKIEKIAHVDKNTNSSIVVEDGDICTKASLNQVKEMLWFFVCVFVFFFYHRYGGFLSP